MSYAHLEGGIKNSFIIYIKFLNNLLSNKFLSLDKDNIDDIMLDLIFFNRVKKFTHNTRDKRLEGLKDFKHFFIDKNLIKIEVKVIDTKSNLNFKVLKEIYQLINITLSSDIEMERKFIDKLIKRRNAIAHGENISDEIDIVIDGIGKVLKILDLVKLDIENKIFTFKDIL